MTRFKGQADVGLLVRSMLIVPSLKPDLLEKSLSTEADALMLELEDGVHETRKDEARQALAAFIRRADFGYKHVTVRINDVRGYHGQRDLYEMVRAGAPTLMLPKVRSVEDVQLADELLKRAEHDAALELGSTGLWCMIETTAAIQDIDRIAAHRRMRGVLFGGGDLSAELGVRRIGIGSDRNIWEFAFELLYAKEKLLIATRSAGIKALDVPHTTFRDLEGTRRAAMMAAQLGFDGMGLVSPRQIPVVHGEFTPSARDVEWARAVLAAIEEADARRETVAVVNGEMIDGPFIISARTIVRRYEEAERRRALHEQLKSANR